MPPSEDQIKDIKSMISVAKRGPVNIGVCLGRTPEDTVVVMHRSRSPAALERDAKAQGETSKACGGTLQIEGRDARMTCDGTPPAALGRQLKMFLKSIGLSLKVTVLDAKGAEI